MRELALAVVLIALGPTVGRAQPIAAALRSTVVTGDDARALELLRADPSREEPRMAYLEARLLDRRGDVLAIERYEHALEDLPAGVARDARQRLALALFRVGRFAEAEARVLELTPNRVIRALLAQLALAQGDAARAEPLLRAAIAEEADDTDGFALRMARAEALESLGRGDEAAVILRDLLLTRPDHPDDPSARLALERLTGAAVVLTFDESLTRAERLSDRFQRDQAIAELRAMPEPEEREARARYRHTLGMAEYAARHDAIAEEVLLGAVADRASTTVDDGYHAVRSGLRATIDAAHVRAMRDWAEANPRDERVVEVLHLAAIAELTYDAPAARRAFEALVRRARSGDYAREARFRLGLFAFDDGEWADADDLFERTSADADVDLDRLRARYWRARTSEARGRNDTAADGYRALVHDAPLGWYAMLARERLVAMGEPDPPALPSPAIDELWSPSRVTLSPEAELYEALGLLGDAAAELRDGEAAARASGGLRALVHQYQDLEDFERAYRLMASSEELTRPPTGGATWAWRASYPSAFEDAARESATAAGIEPAMIWAVMRQESAFDPHVVSVSDAIGLMQLLPATAARTAAGLGGSVRREDLFTPRANIRLGTAYLAALVDELGVPLAFAAYNAGEHRVRQWLVGRECEELDRFVDTIPFEQTRNYTRRVTGNLIRYTALLAGSADWPVVALRRPAGGSACPTP